MPLIVVQSIAREILIYGNDDVKTIFKRAKDSDRYLNKVNEGANRIA